MASHKSLVAEIAILQREDTRLKRLAQAIAWMDEGKRRNWKYEHC